MKMATASSTTNTFYIDVTMMSARTNKNLFLNESFADFHFRFNEGGVQKSIPAHKAVLAAASDAFAAMLNGQWVEKHETEIDDASYDAFKEFLQFVYFFSTVNISTENVWEIIYLANKYNISNCKELCAKQIIRGLTLDDACTCLDLALKFDLIALKNRCLETISYETSEVLATEGFLCCSKDSLEIILAMDDISCDETEMFNGSLNWAKHVCEIKKKDSSIENIKEELGDCLKAIRFGTMNPEDISSCVSKNKKLFDQSELIDLFSTIGPEKSEVKIFTNFAPRTPKWSDEHLLQCNLGGENNRKYCFDRISSTKFQISQPLLFGGISVRTPHDTLRGDNEVNLIVLQVQSNYRKILLQQTIQPFPIPATSKYLKFKKPIRVKANTKYEIRIESQCYFTFFGSNMGLLSRRNFGNGITITTSLCSNFVESLMFNQSL